MVKGISCLVILCSCKYFEKKTIIQATKKVDLHHVRWIKFINKYCMTKFQRNQLYCQRLSDMPLIGKSVIVYGFYVYNSIVFVACIIPQIFI